jgi:hypothetical protein
MMPLARQSDWIAAVTVLRQHDHHHDEVARRPAAGSSILMIESESTVRVGVHSTSETDSARPGYT